MPYHGAALHRFLRDDQPQIPSGPEGSSGSGEVGPGEQLGPALIWKNRRPGNFFELSSSPAAKAWFLNACVSASYARAVATDGRLGRRG